MSNRIRPGLRTNTRACGRPCPRVPPAPPHSSPPVPVPLRGGGPAHHPGYRVLVADAEIPPYCPPYFLRVSPQKGHRTFHEGRPPRLPRPPLPRRARWQRLLPPRRAALVLALDGIDVGPRVIHGHRIGRPVMATPMGVAADERTPDCRSAAYPASPYAVRRTARSPSISGCAGTAGSRRTSRSASTPGEAEILHAQLCYALDDATASVITPVLQAARLS